MKNDSKHSYLANYFYGLNSGMIDVKCSGGTWRRFVFDNTAVTVNVVNSSGIGYITFNPNSDDNDTTMLYYYNIGSSYTSFGSYSWYSVYLNESKEWQLNSVAPNIYWFNCGIENGINDNQTITGTSSCYPNAYYPIMEQPNVNLESVYDNQSTIMNNESSIISKVDKVNQLIQAEHNIEERNASSRHAEQQSEANSRQSEIMDAGSDVTVSTVDDWVNGQSGLAGKLTELAATLSSNADIFSQNQVSNQENLSRAGDFVNGVFNQVPTGIVAACLCFLIILIAVKVVGR